MASTKTLQLPPLPAPLTPQARNQEFFSAGEISENKGTSTNIWSATYERKAPQGKISEIFFLYTLETAF